MLSQQRSLEGHCGKKELSCLLCRSCTFDLQNGCQNSSSYTSPMCNVLTPLQPWIKLAIIIPQLRQHRHCKLQAFCTHRKSTCFCSPVPRPQKFVSQGPPDACQCHRPPDRHPVFQACCSHWHLHSPYMPVAWLLAMYGLPMLLLCSKAVIFN